MHKCYSYHIYSFIFIYLFIFLKLLARQYLWTDESRSIHDALGQRWKHIWRNQVLSKNHGKIIKESQHENLEEVHEYK